MKAIILAGGNATRLYPTTLIMPKQLVMINGYPVIHYLLRHCKNNGVNDIVICLSDSGVRREFSNALEGRYDHMEIDYSISPRNFGTSGRVLVAANTLREKNFVVYYGDIITGFSLRNMILEHVGDPEKPICTIAVTDDKEMEFGVAKFEPNSNKISRFVERPRMKEISSFKVNVGISVCNRGVSDYCREQEDFYGDTVPRMLSAGETVNGYSIDQFIDIGTFSSIEKARKMLKKRSDNRVMAASNTNVKFE